MTSKLQNCAGSPSRGGIVSEITQKGTDDLITQGGVFEIAGSVIPKSPSVKIL